MQLVTTRNQDDCGICALSMVLDMPYEQVWELYSSHIPMKEIDAEPILQKHGWWTLTRWFKYYTGPFAERHLVFLMNPAGGPGHYVAMEADGTVLDSVRGVLPSLEGLKIVWVTGMLKAVD